MITEHLQIRVQGDASQPTLVYLPGMHGDWTLVSSFRAMVAGRVRFVEFTYSQTATESLDDYAHGIENALLENGVTEGWLIGESFGSQPAWQLIKRSLEKVRARHAVKAVSVPSHAASRRSDARDGTGLEFSEAAVGAPAEFQPQGLILAGGFARHPTIWAVRMAHRVSGCVPLRAVKLFCRVYAWYAKFRHRRAPEPLSCIQE